MNWYKQPVRVVYGFYVLIITPGTEMKFCVRLIISGVTATVKHFAKQGNFINGSYGIPANCLPTHSQKSSSAG